VGTLASLAVTGDLTVDTSTLKVDAANNRVGIGTASPGEPLSVSSSSVFSTVLSLNNSSVGGGKWGLTSEGSSGTVGAFSIYDYASALTRLTINASGNVGIGVTPSAWGSGQTALEFGPRGGLSADSGATYVDNNRYFNGTSNIYKATAAASLYSQVDGIHAWLNAASGTAGTTATFTECARITAGGSLCVGVTERNPISTGVAGISFDGVTSKGLIVANRDGGDTLAVGRLTDDGDIVSFFQDGAKEGSISVSGNTVSYNAFAGSHWSQLEDGSKPDILRGTVIESIDELCEWPDETNERLPKCKVSNTAGSKKVYGVFMGWDNDWTETNDMYVTALGAFVCRISADVTVEQGDLLESNGDGTARVQADDVIRSSTIGKVTSTVKTHEYEDGTYCVPVVLYCG
jgi:hypothetical protein